jgi:hypothetical protein
VPLERWTSIVINGYTPSIDTLFFLRYPGLELHIYHATRVRNEYLDWVAIDSPRYPLGALRVGMTMAALFRAIGPVSSEMDPTATEANLALELPGTGESLRVLVLHGRVRRFECLTSAE